ncbi:MAG: DinB family protein [Acidobacteria bacterium]|nr:DinB family protein [Acidobacteriota bacterium]
MSHRPAPPITLPGPDEFAIFYAGYINKVPASGPLAALEAQRADIRRFEVLNDAKASFRYDEGKWSVKEVLGHIADAERVFGYRLLRIARADTTPLAGFDENQWAATAPYHQRSIKDIVHELLAVREATLALVYSLDEAALGRSALANNKAVSARALCWILAGHSQHHLMILHERYGVRELWGATVQPSWEPGVLGG